MLKDAPMGSPIFHIYNVVYLTLFTGIMTFGMLYVFYITYQAPNPLKDVEKMLGKSSSSYTIVQKNMIKDELTADQKNLEDYFKTSEIQRFYITDTATGEPVMTVFLVASGGFGGAVKTLVGLDGTKVLGINVTDVVTETPGLGQRVAEFRFQRQFLNRTKEELPIDRTEWVSKNIDMISGATFSSTSIVNNVRKAFDLYAVGGNE